MDESDNRLETMVVELQNLNKEPHGKEIDDTRGADKRGDREATKKKEEEEKSSPPSDP